MIDPSIHVCVDRPLSTAQLVKSWHEATQERAGNAYPAFAKAARSLPFDPKPEHLGVFVAKHWEKGQVLPVAFAPGTSRSLVVKLMTMANETGWPGDLRYRDVPTWEQGEIRVNFLPDQGSYSMIGTDARLVPKSELTLNLGWIDDRTDDREVFRTWVHEIGHSRGYPHNQSLPNFDVPLRKDYMIQWYMRTQGWSRQEAEAQFEQIAAGLLQFSPVNDLSSLMQYPIPAQFVATGREVPMNWVLSEEDKRFDLQVYPPQGTPVPPPAPTQPTAPKVLVVGGDAIDDSISVRKEVDWWPVTLVDPGVYRFRTEPAMVMGLYNAEKTKLLSASTYGPTDARTDLVLELTPASYVLGVKHHFAGGIGPYRVSLAKVA